MILKSIYKSIIIITIILVSNACSSQNPVIPQVSNTYYKSLIITSINYYEDSLSSGSKTWHVTEAYVAELDTLNHHIVLVLDHRYRNPIPSFNPTHIYIDSKNLICLIRFHEDINPELIKTLGFKFIDTNDIKYIDSEQIKHLGEATVIGHTNSLLTVHTKEKITRQWYKPAERAPAKFHTIDIKYIQEGMKYEGFLKQKRKEYGYE